MAMNPFPLLPNHVVFASKSHIPQEFSLLDQKRDAKKLEDVLRDLCQLALRLPNHVGFYNGVGAGASIPGHFHFQFFHRAPDFPSFPIEERDFTTAKKFYQSVLNEYRTFHKNTKCFFKDDGANNFIVNEDHSDYKILDFGCLRYDPNKEIRVRTLLDGIGGINGNDDMHIFGKQNFAKICVILHCYAAELLRPTHEKNIAERKRLSECPTP